MQDVAARAQVSLRSVYDLASSKEELHTRVHELRARALLERMRGALARERDDPRQALMDLVEVVANFLMEHPDFLRIQLREGGTWALEDSRRVLLVGERHASDRLLETLFRQGIRKGVFHAEDPRLMVASLRAQEQVYLAAWAARGGRISRRATVERIQRQVDRLFCR
jgi:AcrR family transcriptional regulator